MKKIIIVSALCLCARGADAWPSCSVSGGKAASCDENATTCSGGYCTKSYSYTAATAGTCRCTTDSGGYRCTNIDTANCICICSSSGACQ